MNVNIDIPKVVRGEFEEEENQWALEKNVLAI